MSLLKSNVFITQLTSLHLYKWHLLVKSSRKKNNWSWGSIHLHHADTDAAGVAATELAETVPVNCPYQPCLWPETDHCWTSLLKQNLNPTSCFSSHLYLTCFADVDALMQLMRTVLPLQHWAFHQCCSGNVRLCLNPRRVIVVFVHDCMCDDKVFWQTYACDHCWNLEIVVVVGFLSACPYPWEASTFCAVGHWFCCEIVSNFNSTTQKNGLKLIKRLFSLQNFYVCSPVNTDEIRKQLGSDQ